MPCVSVVIPTRDRPVHLRNCLDALREQTLDARLFEVIVVDDGVGSEARDVVDAWAGRAAGTWAVRYVRTGGNKGPANARNLGWRSAGGKIVAFTDDDCIPHPEWLRAGVDAFGPDVVGVAGRVCVPLPDVPTDYQLNVAALQHSRFVTANCFYLRSVVEHVNGFDERFRMAWREDSDLLFRVQRQCPGRLVDEPSALVTHPARAAPWGVSVLQQRKSMYNALLYKKHPDFYRSRVQATPPWGYYRIVGLLLAAAGSLALRRRHAAMSFAAGWLALTARFAVRRLAHTSRRPEHLLEMALTSACIPPLALFWRLRGAAKFRVFFL